MASPHHAHTRHAPAAAPAAAMAAAAPLPALKPLPSSLPWPPHMPLAGHEPGSFAQGTITSRLGAIVDGMLKDMEGVASSSLSSSSSSGEEMASQLRAAIQEILVMRRELSSAATFLPGDLTAPQHCSESLRVSVASTNEAMAAWRARLQEGRPATWLELPWLFVECYMYARIAAAIERQPLLAASRFDPFKVQKLSAFEKSRGSIASMASALLDLIPLQQDQQQLLLDRKSKEGGGVMSKEMKEVFYQVTQFALWGNKTDLSLLIDASKIDPAALSAPALGSSSGAEGASSPFLIVDEFEACWDLLVKKSVTAGEAGPPPPAGGGRRVDIILDNSGLELYSDLCFADALITLGLADQVHFHGKPFAWFVSDTTREDFEETLDLCSSSSSPPASSSSEMEGWSKVQALAGRWRGHLAVGRWAYMEHPYWVTPLPFCWMKDVTPDLYAAFSGPSCTAATSSASPSSPSDDEGNKVPAANPAAAASGAQGILTVLKGDLNYRKLTFDCRWPWTTPFSHSLQGFRPAPLLSLRTLKADVIAGLKPGEGEALSKIDKNWQTNGKFGVIQFVPMI